MKLSAEVEITGMIKPVLLALGILFCVFSPAIALPTNEPGKDTLSASTQQEAIAFMNKISTLERSPHWPNIRPAWFLQNLKANVQQPVLIYPGNGTNFCGYGALTYLFLRDDPLGYAKLLLQLYRDGAAKFGNTSFNPSPAIKKEAGRLKYKGILDIHPAEQMWFLTVAGHFKGYVNIFNRNYDPGDENTFWASTNYAKFNRMVRSILRYKTKAKGADLMRPRINDLYHYISERMETGMVVLYINNRIVHKKDHTIKLAVPTHFIVVEKISRENDVITLVYWDYGGRTQLQMSAAFFKRIIFGITHCTKKDLDAK
ncbi:MAG TPA: hypothetical protein VK484_13685 [Ferruginibacter sp.]|nr:hypothetical protein [Ferruginibacter sp.]